MQKAVLQPDGHISPIAQPASARLYAVTAQNSGLPAVQPSAVEDVGLYQHPYYDVGVVMLYTSITLSRYNLCDKTLASSGIHKFAIREVCVSSRFWVNDWCRYHSCCQVLPISEFRSDAGGCNEF